MTLAQLFMASVMGFPEVESLVPIKGATSNTGQVVELKVSPGNGYKGCGVSFPGLNYVTWFYAEDGNDKRHKYMKDLKLQNPYVNALMKANTADEFSRIVYGSWFTDEKAKFNALRGTPVPMPVCTKPNCQCLEAEEVKQGGPVKSYPCLAENSSDMEQEKATEPGDWLKKFTTLKEAIDKRNKDAGLH